MKQSCNLEQRRLSHIPWICGPHPWQFSSPGSFLNFSSTSENLIQQLWCEIRGLCVKRCPRKCDNQQVWESWSQGQCFLQRLGILWDVGKCFKTNTQQFCGQRKCFCLGAFTILMYVANFQDGTLLCKHI